MASWAPTPEILIQSVSNGTWECSWTFTQVALLLGQACMTGAGTICSMTPCLRHPCVSHHSVICTWNFSHSNGKQTLCTSSHCVFPTHCHWALPKAVKHHFWANRLCGLCLSRATIRTSCLLGTEKPDLRTVVPTYTRWLPKPGWPPMPGHHFTTPDSCCLNLSDKLLAPKSLSQSLLLRKLKLRQYYYH